MSAPSEMRDGNARAAGGPRKTSDRAIGAAWGLCAALIWGSYLAFARAGILAGLDTFDMIFLRFVTAGLFMFPWLLALRAREQVRTGVKRSLVLTILAGPLLVALAVGGFEFAPLSHGALIQPGALIAGSTVFGIWLLRESMTASRYAGLVVILAGLSLIVGPVAIVPSGNMLIGDAMFLASAIMWAMFAVLLHLWSVPPLAATATVSVLSAAVVAPAYLTARGVGALLQFPLEILLTQALVQGILLGVVAVVAFTHPVRRLGAAQAACFPATVPAIALVVGIPVTGELPTPTHWLGLGVVTLGLLTAVGVLGPRNGQVAMRNGEIEAADARNVAEPSERATSSMSRPVPIQEPSGCRQAPPFRDGGHLAPPSPRLEHEHRGPR